MLIPVIVVTVVAIITVMFVTGTVSQFIIRMDKKAEMKKMQVMEEKTDGRFL